MHCVTHILALETPLIGGFCSFLSQPLASESHNATRKGTEAPGFVTDFEQPSSQGFWVRDEKRRRGKALPISKGKSLILNALLFVVRMNVVISQMLFTKRLIRIFLIGIIVRLEARYR